MSKKTGYLLGILLTIVIGTILYWKLCCSCSCNKDSKPKITEPVVAKPTPTPKKEILSAYGIENVNDALLLKMRDDFIFGKSKLVLADSLSKDKKGLILQEIILLKRKILLLILI